MYEIGDGAVDQYYEEGWEDAELDMECSTLAVDELLINAETALAETSELDLLILVYRKGRRDRLRKAIKGVVA